MILEETYTLSNGLPIPKLGLGTWFINNDGTAEAIRQAAAIGYRHVDTAQAYGNEEGVGDGIRSCGLPRDEMFVTSKLAADDFTSGLRLSLLIAAGAALVAAVTAVSLRRPDRTQLSNRALLEGFA